MPAIATLLIYALIFVIVIGVFYYLAANVLPEPLRRYAIAIVVVIGAILLIWFLVGLAGGEGPRLSLHRVIPAIHAIASDGSAV